MAVTERVKVIFSAVTKGINKATKKVQKGVSGLQKGAKKLKNNTKSLSEANKRQIKTYQDKAGRFQDMRGQFMSTGKSMKRLARSNKLATKVMGRQMSTVDKTTSKFGRFAESNDVASKALNRNLSSVEDNIGRFKQFGKTTDQQRSKFKKLGRRLKINKSDNERLLGSTKEATKAFGWQISTAGDNIGRMKQLSKVTGNQKEKFKNLGYQIQGTGKNMQVLGGEEQALQRASKAIGKDLSTTKNILEKSDWQLQKNSKGAYQLKHSMTGATASIKSGMKDAQQSTKAFRFEFLSVMFFGMQMKRIFQGFLKSAVKTYSKVTEKQTELGKQIQRTQAAWEYFKFSMMEAMKPLIMWATEIAVSFMDWASARPGVMKLVGGVAILGLVVGTVMMTVGQFGLAIQGMAKLAAGARAYISGLQVVFGGLGISMSTVLIIALAVAAVAAIIAQAWLNNWGGIRQMVGGFLKWFGGIYDKYILPTIKMFGVGIITLGNVIAAALAAAGDAISLFIYAARYAFDKLKNFLLNTVGKAFNKVAKIIADFVNVAIKGWNAIPWTGHIEPIEPFQLNIEGLKTSKEKFKEYKEGMARATKNGAKDFENMFKNIESQSRGFMQFMEGSRGEIQKFGQGIKESGEKIDKQKKKGEWEEKMFWEEIPGLGGGKGEGGTKTSPGGKYIPPQAPTGEQTNNDYSRNTTNIETNLNMEGGGLANKGMIKRMLDERDKKLINDINRSSSPGR